MESQPALILAIDLAPRSTDLDQGIFDFAGKLIERFRWICPIHIVTFGPLSASVFARNVTIFPDEIKTLPRGTPDLRLVQDLFNEDLRLDEFHHVLFISCGTSEFSVPDSFFAPLFFIFTAPETQLNEEVAMRAWRHVMGRYIARGEEPNEKLMNHTRPCFVDLYNSLDDSLVATEIHLGCHNKLTIELGENLNFEVKCTPSICPYRSREKWLNVNEGILSVIGSVKMARLTNIASTNESIYAFRPSDEPKDADAYTVIAKSLAAEGFMLLCIYDEYYQALLRPVRSEHSDSWELSMQFIKSFATKENQWHLVSSKKKLPLRPTSYSVSSGLSYQCAATRNYWMNDNGLQSEIHRLTRSLKREDKVEALYQDINRIGLHALATSQHEFAPTILKILESRLPSSIVPTMHGHLKAIIDVLKKNGFEGWSKMKKK